MTTHIVTTEILDMYLKEVDQYAALRNIPRENALRELLLRGLTWSRPML